jgi:hypothetical protein
VYQDGTTIRIRSSSNNGVSWDTRTVTSDGADPEIVLLDSGDVYCYFIRDSTIYCTMSMDNGTTWSTPELVNAGIIVDTSQNSPYQVTEQGLVFAKDDGDLYAYLFLPTYGAKIHDIEASGGRLHTTITNGGSENLSYFDWEIMVEGDAPLAQYFGLLGSPLEGLFRGRVFRGAFSTDYVINIKPGTSIDVSSSPVFGLGHVMVTVRVIRNNDVVSEKSEDGFLFGGQMFLYYPEE